METPSLWHATIFSFCVWFFSFPTTRFFTTICLNQMPLSFILHIVIYKWEGIDFSYIISWVSIFVSHNIANVAGITKFTLHIEFSLFQYVKVLIYCNALHSNQIAHYSWSLIRIILLKDYSINDQSVIPDPCIVITVHTNTLITQRRLLANHLDVFPQSPWIVDVLA